MHYEDKEDVWNIKREYWTGDQKTPTKLPADLIEKILLYSSKENDIVLDPFLGSGQVAVVSKITLPWNTEAGYGAIAFDGTIILNEGMVQRLVLDESDIEKGIENTQIKVKRRVAEFKVNVLIIKSRDVLQ